MTDPDKARLFWVETQAGVYDTEGREDDSWVDAMYEDWKDALD